MDDYFYELLDTVVVHLVHWFFWLVLREAEQILFSAMRCLTVPTPHNIIIIKKHIPNCNNDSNHCLIVYSQCICKCFAKRSEQIRFQKIFPLITYKEPIPGDWDLTFRTKTWNLFVKICNFEIEFVEN